MAPPFNYGINPDAQASAVPMPVQQPPSTIEALIALIQPYLQSQAGQRESNMNSLVRGLQALKGGGVRDSFTGAIRNPDPVVAQQEHDAYWNQLFTPTSDRIAKERARFQTPSDIPTFTEQELAGVNARARGRMGSTRPVAGSQPAGNTPMAVTGSPAPTPLGVSRGPTQSRAAAPSPQAEPPMPPGPPQSVNVRPSFMLPSNPLDAFFDTGPPITPQVQGGQYNYPTGMTPGPTMPWQYGTGTLGPGGEPMPTFAPMPPRPVRPGQPPSWMYGVGTMR